MLHRHQHDGTRTDIEHVAGAQVGGRHLEVVRVTAPALLRAPPLFQIIRAETHGGHAEVFAGIHLEQPSAVVRQLERPHQSQMDRAQQLLWYAAVLHAEMKRSAFAR